MYYPNLRWKQGEMKAIEHAPPHWEEKVTPIWIIEDIADIEDTILGMQSLWQGDQILDLSRFDLHTLTFRAWADLVGSGMMFAIAPEALPQLPMIARQQFETRPIFRIAFQSAEDAKTANVSKQTLSEIAKVKKPLNILDLCNVTPEHWRCLGEIVNIVNLFHSSGDCEMVLSGGCFPSNLQGHLGTVYVERLDKKLYNDILLNTDIRVHYSDYTTLSPLWDSAGIMRTAHSAIRYTLDDEWMVLRDKGKNATALYNLAQLLVLQPEFRGASFSWADEVWEKRAAKPPLTGPGNTTFHVSEFVHHHIAQVVAYG